MNENQYRLKNTEKLTSPSLLFFKDLIVGNIKTAVGIATDPRRIRPHIKTHKTIQVVNLQRSQGIHKFKCATLAEAELLATNGVEDILLAYPVVGPNIARIVSFLVVYPGVSLKVIADDIETLGRLSNACSARNLLLPVLADVNPGMDRTGIPLSGVPDFYEKLSRLPGLSPAGIHYYDGHVHISSLTERMRIASESYAAVKKTKTLLEARGFPVPLLSMGGTPMFPCYAQFPDVELSPGTCFLNDGGYAEAFPDMPFAEAALVFSRVVSLPKPGLFTLDLGYKGISADPPGRRGRILGYEHAEPLFQNEEHWVFSAAGGSVPKIGQELFVVPTHICPTCALYSEAVVVEADGTHEERWPIAARNRKLFI